METVHLRIATLDGRKEDRFWLCDRVNDTFALHRDAALDGWNITHRPSGCAVFIGGVESLDVARSAFDRLVEHHKETGLWTFTSARRMTKAVKQFGKQLRVELGLPASEAPR